MIFNSFEFLIFFPLVLAIARNLAGLRIEKWFLLAASLFFYATWNVPCVLLLIFTSLVDYNVGRSFEKTADPAARRRLLWTSLVWNLGILGFFKYSNFFVENIRVLVNTLGGHLSAYHSNPILPPGISYFTFASLSCVLDAYYERTPACRSALDYTLFISFFPKILSGPIARGRDFLPQLQKRRRADWAEFETGFAQFLLGAVKKMVVADWVALNVNQIFAAPTRFDRFTLVQGLLGYTVQLYCDFSGYSDMAIGAGRMLGFNLPENFQMPFSSVTITEFWRRWHITMSTWFRDYLFLPLELATRDSPRPLLRMSRNMCVTMLLCGLWHGASWTYVVWGGVHGLALATHKLWTTCRPSYPWMKLAPVQLAANIASRILTLGVVLLALVFFRAETLSDALTYLHGMFSAGHHGEHLFSVYIWPAAGVVFLVHLVVKKDWNFAVSIPRRPMGIRIASYAILLILLVSMAATQSTPFIYFKY